MKIVILDGTIIGETEKDWERFRDFGELSAYDITPDEKTIERIGDAELVIVDKTNITEEVLQACPNIKFIGVLATGYNIVDTEAAARHGIPVANVPNYSTDIVAQATIALILEIVNKVGLHNESVHRGDWCHSKYFCYTLGQVHELKGKTIGIIGFGNIGRAVGRIAEAFGMKVLAYSRTKHPEYESENSRYTDLDTLLMNSDIVSVHCPLFPETKEIINRSSIAKMKDGAILINTSRGPCIVEQDVADALKSGKLLAAGLDVMSEEPMRMDNPLLAAPNCIITPHIAWASEEAIQRIRDITYENVRAFLNGESKNIVNGL